MGFLEPGRPVVWRGVVWMGWCGVVWMGCCYTTPVEEAMMTTVTREQVLERVAGLGR
jgi:hypothetical protein